MYLAKLAPLAVWEDDPSKTGWIRVIYKREVRWAKPCLRYGAFEVPDRAWCLRNRKRYRVWVTFEEQTVKRQRQDSLIYMGFMPIGGEVFPEPAVRTEEEYPNVEIVEHGPWRLVITKTETAAKLQLYKITSAPDADVEETKLVAIFDATSILAAAESKFVVYLPYDMDGNGVAQKSMMLNLDSATKQVQLFHGDGMALQMLGTGKKPNQLKNAAGDKYFETNDSGNVINGDTKVQGALSIGLPNALPLAKAQPINAYLTALEILLATFAAGLGVPGSSGAAVTAMGAFTNSMATVKLLMVAQQAHSS